MVRRIFERRAEGLGMYRIGRELDRDKIPTPQPNKKNANKPDKAPCWWATTIGSILDNETYRGVKVYGRTERVKKRGTARVVAGDPERVMTTEAPGLRIISDETWAKVQAVNEQARAVAWRDEHGKLKSRAIASKFLLAPFLACGTCGGAMHAKKSPRGPQFYYRCTRNAQRGKGACLNGAGVRVDHADNAILGLTEEALSGRIVLDALDQVLEAHRQSATDPAPLKAEAEALRLEVERLVTALARGSGVETTLTAAIRDRNAKLEHVQATLNGLVDIKGLDLTKLVDRIAPVLADWRAHLRKNPSTGQQVLRKIIPERLRVSRDPRGGWRLDGAFKYDAVLAELGLDAVRRVVEQVAIPPCALPRGPHPAPPARSRHRRSGIVE